MGLIDNKIQKALEPTTKHLEELMLKAQKENKKLMLEKVKEMLETIDEIVEQKVREAIQKRT